ncbi:hypothetical protein D1007_33796 [Hordeum vulgare]|nr:hypothetical protein D1007_33796 [Hordeum vulgare]
MAFSASLIQQARKERLMSSLAARRRDSGGGVVVPAGLHLDLSKLRKRSREREGRQGLRVSSRGAPPLYIYRWRGVGVTARDRRPRRFPFLFRCRPVIRLSVAFIFASCTSSALHRHSVAASFQNLHPLLVAVLFVLVVDRVEPDHTRTYPRHR